MELFRPLSAVTGAKAALLRSGKKHLSFVLIYFVREKTRLASGLAGAKLGLVSGLAGAKLGLVSGLARAKFGLAKGILR